MIRKYSERLTAIVATQAVARGPERTPAARNVRVAEDNSHYSAAPDPIRSSDWTGVGRDSGRSFRQIAVFSNVADILSQSQDDFSFGPGTIGYTHVPYIPRGKQAPHTERLNVRKPGNVAYGALLQLDAADPPYYGGYIKGGIL